MGSVMRMTCRRCGEILNANANFCWSCGAPQHDATSPETIAVPVVLDAADLTLRGAVASHTEGLDELILTSTDYAGAKWALINDSTSVGRHEESDIVLDDVSVSRHHAILTRTASGRITLRDLNSLNGTYVNGVRVEEVVLHSADEVLVGKFKLIFWGAMR